VSGAAASRRHGAAAFARRAFVAALVCLAACEQPPPKEPEGSPPRRGRFGSLRDLVLFERPELGYEAALFFDRFEVTRGDWRGFAATPAGRAVGAPAVPALGDETWPVGLVDLRQARAFAQWRFLRLPRSDEWRFVNVGDRRNEFPWGSRVDATRANTADLGLGQPTPVGTFESGRRYNQPYDLVGNVSEWTETVPTQWWDDRAIALDPSLPRCRREVLRQPALAAWQLPGGLVPPAWLLGLGGDGVPREVVGGDFLSEMAAVEPRSGTRLLEIVPAGDRRSRTGIRLCATAGELLVALCREAGTLGAEDEVQLRRFVRRGKHKLVLAEAWSALVLGNAQRFGDGAAALVLRQELGFAELPRGR
jgi:hypothetical protein